MWGRTQGSPPQRGSCFVAFIKVDEKLQRVGEHKGRPYMGWRELAWPLNPKLTLSPHTTTHHAPRETPRLSRPRSVRGRYIFGPRRRAYRRRQDASCPSRRGRRDAQRGGETGRRPRTAPQVGRALDGGRLCRGDGAAVADIGYRARRRDDDGLARLQRDTAARAGRFGADCLAFGRAGVPQIRRAVGGHRGEESILRRNSGRRKAGEVEGFREDERDAESVARIHRHAFRGLAARRRSRAQSARRADSRQHRKGLRPRASGRPRGLMERALRPHLSTRSRSISARRHRARASCGRASKQSASSSPSPCSIAPTAWKATP